MAQLCSVPRGVHPASRANLRPPWNSQTALEASIRGVRARLLTPKRLPFNPDSLPVPHLDVASAHYLRLIRRQTARIGERILRAREATSIKCLVRVQGLLLDQERRLLGNKGPKDQRPTTNRPSVTFLLPHDASCSSNRTHVPAASSPLGASGLDARREDRPAKPTSEAPQKAAQAQLPQPTLPAEPTGHPTPAPGSRVVWAHGVVIPSPQKLVPHKPSPA
jgi:hypothetical protein